MQQLAQLAGVSKPVALEITPGQLHADAHEGARVAHQLDRHSGLSPDIGEYIRHGP